MNREQAHDILMKYMKGENYITHSYAVEAIMKGLAKRLAPDEVEYWGIVGLLHDLDEEQCDWQHDLSVHGPTSVEILKKEGFHYTSTRAKSHYVPEDSPLVQALLASYESGMGKPGYCIAIGGGTYVHSVPNGVAFGCAVEGVDNHMHGPDEFAEIAVLKKSSIIFADAILRLCRR